MWKEAGKGMVRWEYSDERRRGGVGLREPICALDAAIRIVGLMIKIDNHG
jgi:hypothetical protein